MTQFGAGPGRASIDAAQGRCVRTPLNGDAGLGSSAVALVTLERLAEGAFAEVDAIVDGEAESLVLYRDGDRVRAWLNVCPHAGRRLDWAPGQFLRSKDGLLVCAAHGAGFELERGECVSGPCRGQSLRAVAVEVRDGAVWLVAPGSV
jgi:nitrite reductase/ring-hydroxylating ferredoxin subunit